MIESGTFLQQRYRIDKQIGQGGMGAVYVATDERFGSTVAIKETLCMSDNYRKAIEREARLLNSLKHSALPRVSDHFLEDDGQFLVMEFVPGDDLGSIMEGGHAPFPSDQVLAWADQLLDALDYLHGQSNPVIHRDIKPQNLKVTTRGQIILLDFGLAKGNPTDAGNKTAAKSIFGYSRNYASLEQIQGTGTDPRSDLYSLAATLYHLMTGVASEDALTRAMAVLSQQPDPLIPASSLRPEIPPGVAAVLAKALDLNATMRPSSAAEMRAMLRDQEKYAHAVPLSSPAIARPTETALLAHATRVHPETTRAAIAGNDAVTELMPETRSQVTSIRNADSDEKSASIASTTRQKAGTFRKLAFAAVFVALGLCAATVGFIAYENGSFGQERPVEALPIKTDVEPLEENSNITDGSTVFEHSAEAESGSKEAPAPPPKQVPPSKPSSERSSADSNSKVSDDAGWDDDEQVVISGDSLKAGNMTMRKGKIVTPDGEIDLNVPRPPNMPLQPGYPIDPKRLSPEQQRRLRMLRQRHPEVFVRPTPY